MRWFVVFSLSFVVSCSAVYNKQSSPFAELRLEVEPTSAGVVIDDEFVGTVESLGGRVIVASGERRVMVRADGYETERFDIAFQSGDEITLELDMISSVDLEDEEPPPRRSILKAKEPRR